jgi:hypothetical protein
MLEVSGLSRREVLQKCLALGSLTLAASHSSAAMLLVLEEKETPRPTPPNELGPFYKKLLRRLPCCGRREIRACPWPFPG